MQGRLIAGATAVAACAATACCLVPSLGQGSDARRGGNHGCSEKTGSMFSDHFFKTGDNISFGFRFEPAGSPRGVIPGGDQDELAVENTPTGGGGPSRASCGLPVGSWNEVQSDLGPGDDSVRLDAKGIEVADEETEYGPIPKSIDSLLVGGRGADKIRGHKGFDDVSGGGGPDVIKVDDGKPDVVKCGGGDDKADVDSKDDVSGCETKT
jgi:hypothetical protein